MDEALIRASFVKINLDRACQDGTGAIASRTFREFRRYLQWHPDAIPEPERSSIAEKICELERRVPYTFESLSYDPESKSASPRLVQKT